MPNIRFDSVQQGGREGRDIWLSEGERREGHSEGRKVGERC